MKKGLILIFSFLLILSITTGALYFKRQNIKKSAWNQLNPEIKVLLKGTWKDGKVTKKILKNSMGAISDKSYLGKEVYLVEFTLDTFAVPNSIEVFVSFKDYKVIGIANSD